MTCVGIIFVEYELSTCHRFETLPASFGLVVITDENVALPLC